MNTESPYGAKITAVAGMISAGFFSEASTATLAGFETRRMLFFIDSMERPELLSEAWIWSMARRNRVSLDARLS